MRGPRQRIAPPDIRHPLPEDRGIDQRILPHRQRQPRIALEDAAERVMRDHRDAGRRQRRDAVVHALQEKALRVENVAGKMKGDDLAPSVGQRVEAADDAFEEQVAIGRPVAFVDQLAVGGRRHHPRVQPLHDVELRLAELQVAVQLARQRAGESLGHGRLPFEPIGMSQNFLRCLPVGDGTKMPAGGIASHADIFLRPDSQRCPGTG